MNFLPAIIGQLGVMKLKNVLIVCDKCEVSIILIIHVFIVPQTFQSHNLRDYIL